MFSTGFSFSVSSRVARCGSCDGGARERVGIKELGTESRLSKDLLKEIICVSILLILNVHMHVSQALQPGSWRSLCVSLHKSPAHPLPGNLGIPGTRADAVGLSSC